MNIKNLASDSEDFTGNVWLVQNSENVLVDAGEGDVWNRIKELDEVSKVVITHSHHDHVKNLRKIVKRYDPEVYAIEPDNISVDAQPLEEGASVKLCGRDFDIYHTPGHKDDSICLHNPETGVLFTGDLIFPDGKFGRTDLAEGDRDILIKSIQKISELEVESFYPGHGEAVGSDAEECIDRSIEEAEKHQPKY